MVVLFLSAVPLTLTEHALCLDKWDILHTTQGTRDVFILPLLTRGHYLTPIRTHFGYHLFDEIPALLFPNVYLRLLRTPQGLSFMPSGLWMNSLSLLNLYFSRCDLEPKIGCSKSLIAKWDARNCLCFELPLCPDRLS